MNTEPTTPRRLETETCSRCGGTGRYSYCQMYGSTCFKCSGSGKQYTKRGAAALAWFTAQRTRKAKDVEIGQWVIALGVPGFSKNAAIKIETMYTRLRSGSHTDSKTGETVWSNHLYLDGFTTKGEAYSLGMFPESDVTIALTKAEGAALLARAVEYQDTLTKAGTPRKR